jgi:hypothetical protein
LGNTGHALDLDLGIYDLAARPDGGADWQLKFGISWLLQEESEFELKFKNCYINFFSSFN